MDLESLCDLVIDSLSHHFYLYSGHVENFFMSHCCCCCCFSTLHLSKRCLLLLFVIFIVDNSPLCYTFFSAPSLIHINITNTEKKEFRLPLLWTDFTTNWFLVLVSTRPEKTSFTLHDFSFTHTSL